MLGDVRARAIFAETHATVPAARLIFIPQRVVQQILERLVPTRITIPAEQIGNLVHLRPGAVARRANRQPRWILAMREHIQVFDFAMRIRAAGPHFIEQTPRKNARVIEVLPD